MTRRYPYLRRRRSRRTVLVGDFGPIPVRDRNTAALVLGLIILALAVLGGIH